MTPLATRDTKSVKGRRTGHRQARQRGTLSVATGKIVHMFEGLEGHTQSVADDLSASDLLASIKSSRNIENAEAARQLVLAARWADLHPPESIHSAATFTVPGCEHEEPIAGEGCPLVAEFCIAELGAELGMSSASAKKLIGHALELGDAELRHQRTPHTRDGLLVLTPRNRERRGRVHRLRRVQVRPPRGDLEEVRGSPVLRSLAGPRQREQVGSREVAVCDPLGRPFQPLEHVHDSIRAHRQRLPDRKSASGRDLAPAPPALTARPPCGHLVDERDKVAVCSCRLRANCEQVVSRPAALARRPAVRRAGATSLTTLAGKSSRRPCGTLCASRGTPASGGSSHMC